MSDDSILWMGNIQEWMNEKKIMQYFREYGFNPYRIKLLKNMYIVKIILLSKNLLFQVILLLMLKIQV
jgi:hypothetical protein